MIGTDVKESACSVIRASAKSLKVGEEGNCVDVGFMTGESLHAATGANVPELCRGITATGDESVTIITKWPVLTLELQIG